MTAGAITPRTPAEALVAAVWCEVLGLDQVAVTDNFFEIGGHSLAAVRVLHELTARTGVELELETFFELETLQQVAAAFDHPRPVGEPTGTSPAYEGEL